MLLGKGKVGGHSAVLLPHKPEGYGNDEEVHPAKVNLKIYLIKRLTHIGGVVYSGVPGCENVLANFVKIARKIIGMTAKIHA